MGTNLSLQGRVALVTGASSGLGARFATVLADAGARVALAARRLDRLERLVATIASGGGMSRAVVLDVTIVPDVHDAVDRIEREWGAIDILINNAGVGRPRPVIEYDESDFDYVMAVNLKAAFFVAQAVGRRMLSRGRGRIINISSSAGLKPMAGTTVYSMSKAAINHMTRVMALEWGPAGINVNTVCPGYIATELNQHYWATKAGQEHIERLPRRRLGQPSDLDELIVYLASDASRFINGVTIPVDDGLSIT